MLATSKKVALKKAVRELKNLHVSGRQGGKSWWCFVCCYPTSGGIIRQKASR